MVKHKAFIEYDGGFIDVSAVVQVDYSTAQGGTVAVATAHTADGAYGQVVARLQPPQDGPGPATMPTEEETAAITTKLRGIAASLTIAMSVATTRQSDDPDEPTGADRMEQTVYHIIFDPEAHHWDVQRAVDTPGADKELGVFQ